MSWQNELEIITSQVKYNEPLSKYTSFRIGGPALAVVEVNSVDELKSLIEFRERFKIPVMVIGRGSNILVSDAGYEGVIVILSTGLRYIQFDGTQVAAGAGITLTQLAKLSTRRGLSGLEFAYGIPGSLGGALIMNAGTHGHSMSKIVTEIHVVSQEGELLTISNEQAEFEYRNSNLKRYFCIFEAILQLKNKPVEEIKTEMKTLYNKRKCRQPLSKHSAGCIFKNPQFVVRREAQQSADTSLRCVSNYKRQAGVSAGKLIDECGLKGAKVGGAEVSQKHANFIINTGTATAADVLTLIDKIRKQVKLKTGIELELEIQQI